MTGIQVVELGSEHDVLCPSCGSSFNLIAGTETITERSTPRRIQHFELVMPNRGVPTPVDEVYAATEAPNGELGLQTMVKRWPCSPSASTGSEKSCGNGGLSVLPP